MHNYIIEILELSRNLKKTATIFLDIILILFSCYFAETIINQSVLPFSKSLALYFIICTLTTMIVYATLGFYNILSRHFSISSVFSLLFLTVIIISILTSLRYLIDLRYLNINFIFQQTLILFILTLLSRLIFQNIISHYFFSNSKFKTTIIYGTDYEEIDIYKNLANKKKYKIIGFLDNDKNKIGRTIDGLKIYSSDNLIKLTKKINIQNCLIIRNKVDTNTLSLLENKLSKFDIKLIYLNNKNLSEDNATINFQNTKLAEYKKKFFNNKTILVTGAAGSIGKEICLQLQKSDAKRIIGIDISEYLIARFNRDNNNGSKIEMVMGDVTNQELIKNIFIKYKPSIIFHAAANKHVDLVQKNYDYSLFNNLVGVYNLLKISSRKNFVKRFVFISTDKAVDPSNYMGASKMLGEILTNYFALRFKKNFSSVRFGNVIGSSGSFLEIIKDQIAKGGPITLTDKGASRYFMTISDAVNLVLQTASQSCFGGVHVLKMGNAINILDLIKRILNLNNLTIKDKNNMNGDIKIKIIGLKEGEKMHEKLYNNNAKIIKTKNKLIDYEYPSKFKQSSVLRLLKYCETKSNNKFSLSSKELVKEFLKN